MDADHRPPKEGRPVSDQRESAASDPPKVQGGGPPPKAQGGGRPPEAEGRRRRNRHHAFRRKNNRARKASRPEGSPPTSAEMRAARASGRTPGSSTADEPSAAPLGTDDEAAGTPPSAAEL